MKKGRIAVIGRAALGTQLLDGQTIKTKVLYEELKNKFPEREIMCVDMYKYMHHIIRILWQTLCAFIKCEHIFVLLSRNGRTLFFPIITFLNKIFKRKLYHDVIGGALANELRSRPALGKDLKSFTVNWVESPVLRDELKALGVENVEVLPNFRRIADVKLEDLPNEYQKPYVFSMFSRVVKEKGIEDAVKAIEKLNEKSGFTAAVLQIYGPVEPVYQQRFDEILKNASDAVMYKGVAPFEESTEILKNSFCLLFPSVYPGEGIPGTIIDAFSAGVPVIATDWHFNSEMVRHGVNGYCYDYKKPELLEKYVEYAVKNPEEIKSMRLACLNEAQKYKPDAVMDAIEKQMEL